MLNNPCERKQPKSRTESTLGSPRICPREGRCEEAVAEATRAHRLDPVSASSNTLLGMVLYRARRYDGRGFRQFRRYGR
jgi:Flp pilus assembly protein TadD